MVPRGAGWEREDEQRHKSELVKNMENVKREWRGEVKHLILLIKILSV